MASANVPAPNLSITKTDGVTTVYRGGPVSYTIVVTNSSTYTVTGTYRHRARERHRCDLDLRRFSRLVLRRGLRLRQHD